MRTTLLFLTLAALLAGCGETPGKIIGIDDAGVVAGLAYIDRDGDGTQSQNDGVAAGVNAALLLEATGDTVARATSRADGTFVMTRVPVGRYLLVANRGTLGDTLTVLQVENPQITLAVGDTAVRLIRIGFTSTPITQARALNDGEQVVLHGMALNGWPTFGDSTVHLKDATGTLRAIRVPGPAGIAAGDSVRMVGFMATRTGQRVLAAASATIIRKGAGLPEPDSLSTAVAASAAGGSRDADQVRTSGTIIGSQELLSGDYMLTIDDGSGRLEVIFDMHINFGTGAFVPGAVLNVTGVLVPTTAGAWQLKPRAAADARATYPTITIAQARALPVGRAAYVVGVAISGSAVFGDQSFHLKDATGTIRIVQMPLPTIFAGDSVRILGVGAVRNGQPVLVGVSSAVLLAGVGVSQPDSVSTQVAATAGGGSRDAGQVAVSGKVSAVVIEPVTNDILVTISDGSGDLVVRLHRVVGFVTGSHKVDDVIRARGVLVPSATSPTWELKPRTIAEIVVTSSGAP
jgi:hypothetical protein